MRITPPVLMAAGVTLTTGALATIVVANDYTSATQLALVVLLLGVGSLLASYLGRQGTDVDAAYRLGYDLGYERGHRDAIDEIATGTRKAG